MPEPAPPASAPSSAYDPSEIEARWYRYWEEGGFFRADAARVLSGDAPAHVIPMPPPNVTGRLHMGHALQDAVQDALTRLRRMQGAEALWIPGTDHAGIATQNVVERKLRQEGLDRKQMGREAFLRHVWDYVEEYGGIILQQKRRLGDSCDWSRERFTLDERYARVVQDVFVRLYEEGLVYRGDYLVNWDPENQTVLSNEEVDNVERDGHLWTVRYPVVDDAGADTGAFLSVATTRPETIPADTAVAVHPEDERFTDLVGRRVRVPLSGRLVPVIADDYIKMDFGAGALKVTPGHDQNDFEIGQRHGLEVISIMNPDATLNEAAGPYAGLDRFEARKQLVADLDAAGLLEKTEDYRHSVPISSRSGGLIEPLISLQWYVKMQPLAEPAIAAVRDGRVRFHPERWAGEFFRWMESIRDWPISRQLWWGHRIPVWYPLDPATGERDEEAFVVSVESPGEGYVQDEDVLDTWFSSWLWPFATLGWPEETEDLKAFYPSAVLVSGYDILFFWIARMVMAGLHFTGEAPFRDVYVTGMIKDKQGRWMSKSLGNGIDPLDMIETYGADAVRFSLNVLCTPGQDIRLDPAKFEMGRNFANKIWNAFNVFGRFMETAPGSSPGQAGRPARDYRRQRSFEELELVERWILTRLNQTIRAVDEAAGRYRLNEAALAIYDLFWRDYCDWYLELIKPPHGEAMDEEKIALAVEVFERMVQLLHPFMPFITEALWWRLRPRREGEACIASDWPTPNDAEVDEAAAEAFGLVQEVVSGVRSVKSQYGVAPGKPVAATIRVPTGEGKTAAALAAAEPYVRQLARVDDLAVGIGAEKPKAAAVFVAGSAEVFVPLAGMIDLDEERARLEKEVQQKEGFLQGVERKLANEQFTSKAPPAVVERERQKAADAQAEIAKLRANLADLG